MPTIPKVKGRLHRLHPPGSARTRPAGRTQKIAIPASAATTIILDIVLSVMTSLPPTVEWERICVLNAQRQREALDDGRTCTLRAGLSSGFFPRLSRKPLHGERVRAFGVVQRPLLEWADQQSE